MSGAEWTAVEKKYFFHCLACGASRINVRAIVTLTLAVRVDEDGEIVSADSLYGTRLGPVSQECTGCGSESVELTDTEKTACTHDWGPREKDTRLCKICGVMQSAQHVWPGEVGYEDSH